MTDRAAAREAYDRDGYLVVRGAVPAVRRAPLQALIEREVELLAEDLLRRGVARDPHRDLPFPRRLAALLDGTGMRMRKWSHFLFGPEVHGIVTAPTLVDALTAVLGPEVIFHGDYQLTPKLPGNEIQAFPWHQDTLYYGRPSQHLHIVTAWLALVDADETNGCLQVIPGSHCWGLLDGVRGADMNVHPQEDVTRRGRPVSLPVQAGDAVLMSHLTFHASGLNRSNAVRWSMDLGFSARLDDGTASPDVRASRDYVFAALRAAGRTPLCIASADAQRIASFADWEREHLAIA
jgi:ectoine hydroxylase-related dioxygenase (phytanoyl-CoA dioxygenase family)